MINNVLSLIAGLLVGVYLQYQVRKVREDLSTIKNSLLERPKVSPTVVSGNPTLARPERATAVISPKTPQMIDFEENEEIRRMNPGS